EPTFAPAYLERGAAKLAAERFQEAVADLDRGIELDPTSSWSHMRRGLAHLSIEPSTDDRVDQAIHDLTRAIEIDPTFVVAYELRAMAYGRKGDVSKS